MIAKTITGKDFEGALTYGAGLRQGRGKLPGQAPLLVVANVIPGSPKQMAQDMQAMAARSKKIQKPVWHTVLSWKAGERVSQEQKVAAAKRYCALIGAPVDRHQVVVYEHRDKEHAHIHIYLNRVPIDGGAALRTDNNFYRQPAITRQISQELGMAPLPERQRILLPDPDPATQAARELVSRVLLRLLSHPDRGGEQWLALHLQKARISVRFTHDKGGILRGVRFEVDGIALRGQQVGYKGAQIRQALAAPVQPATPATAGPPLANTSSISAPEASSKPGRAQTPQRARRKGPAR
ncbi:relaxase/mobilization nuclease domain-containing protein [Hymenobacter actinosclerus]|uniref:Relaxase/Mobilisation nuclease domain-containing protein n=1 Tax=Hymenobacter actinosclerus TaxID=82805 RepID=A0A1I0IK31_9BACT|nr:relaxase/mobilization nuclease domain-containing protein [Hymenobacter actinosclerus]SET97430.1 Relaxase/Mobilisation nuclease domain-containing protein [Hymenobacter actinosclerus]